MFFSLRLYVIKRQERKERCQICERCVKDAFLISTATATEMSCFLSCLLSFFFFLRVVSQRCYLTLTVNKVWKIAVFSLRYLQMFVFTALVLRKLLLQSLTRLGICKHCPRYIYVMSELEMSIFCHTSFLPLIKKKVTKLPKYS